MKGKFILSSDLVNIYNKEGFSSNFLKTLVDRCDILSYDKTKQEELTISDIMYDSFQVKKMTMDSSNGFMLYIETVPVPITLEKAEITDEYIYITSSSTCFIILNNHKKVDIKNVLKKYTEVIKACREQKIKISYSNHYKKTLLDENFVSSYNKEFDEFEDIYNQLKDGWTEKLKKGLFRGVRDDEEYNALGALYCKAQPYNYRNSFISRIEDIQHTIDTYYKDIVENKFNNNYYKIVL